MKCLSCGTEMERRPKAKTMWAQFRAQDIEVHFCPACRKYRVLKVAEKE